MSYDIGPRIGIEGEKAFKASITALNAQMKNFGSEMKATAAAFGKANQSEEKLTAQNKVLAKSLDTAKEKMKLLTNQYETQKGKLGQLEQTLNQVKAAFGEQSEEAVEAQNAYNKQAKEVADLGTQLNKTAAEISGMEREVAANSAAMEKAKAATTKYAQEQRQAEEAAKQLKEQQEKLAAQVTATSDKLNASAQAIGGVNRAAVVAAAALGGLALVAGKVGADFEAQISKVEAISGATAQEMETLSEKAQEMGATTKFTATEAGQALEYMAMAGWKPEQMLSGLEGVMNLAAASGEDLASVSDIVTDALTAFGLKASDSAHFADVLAKAAASSNTNVSMLGQTFQYAAPVAGALGYSVEDVAVAVGLMANAGIKGEKSGTALRGMLTNLAKPSDQVAGYMDKLGISLTDASGEIKPLNTLLVDMRQKFAGLTEAQKAEYAAGIAGKEAMSGMLAVVNASDADFNNLTRAIASSNGTAKKMADTMGKNLKGQLTLLKSAAEGVGIAFYEKFQGPATEAVETVTKKVSAFGQALASGELDGKLHALAAGAVAAGTALVGLNAALAVKDVKNLLSFVKGAQDAGKALKDYEAATKAAAIAQKALTVAQAMTPWAWVALAAGAAAAAFVTYKAMTNDATSETAQFKSELKELNTDLDEQAQKQEELANSRAAALGDINSESDTIQRYVQELKNCVDENGKVNEKYKDRAAFLAEQINNYIPGAIEANENEAGSYYKISDAIDDMLFAKKKEMTLAAWEDEYKNALKERSAAWDKVTEATKLQYEAQEKLNKITAELNSSPIHVQERSQWKIDEAKRDLERTTVAVEDAKNAWSGFNTTVSGFETAYAAENMQQLSTATANFSQEIIKADTSGGNTAALEEAVAYRQRAYQTMVAETAAAWSSMSDVEKSNAADMLTEQKSLFDSQAQEARRAGVELPTTFGASITENGFQVSDSLQALLDENNAIMGNSGYDAQRLAEANDYLIAEGILNNKGAPIGAAETVTQEAVVAAGSIDSEPVGRNLASGVTRGIQYEGVSAVTALRSMVSQAISAAKKEAGIASPSRVMRDKVGVMLAKGMAVGIENGKKTVADSSSRMAQAAINATQTALDIHSPSGKTMTLGMFTAMGFAIGMQSKLKLVKKTARNLSQTVLKQIDSLNDEIAKIQETAQKRQTAKELADYEKSIQDKHKDMEKQERELEEKLAKAKAKDKAKIEQDGLEAREKALEELAKLEADWNEKQLKAQEQAQQEALKSQISALQEVQKEYETALQKIESKQTTLSDKLKGYGELFTWVKDKTKETLEMGDLQEDIDAITAYGEALEQLRDGAENRRGISESLLNEILSMNTEDALAYTDKLLKMTDEDYETYLSKWDEKQKLADEIAREFYQKEMDALNEEFAGKIPESMDAMKTDMYDVGINAALGLAKGMWSERHTVIDTAVRIADMAYGAAKKSQKINSPSKKWAELGNYMAQGVGVGFTEQMRGVARDIANSIPVPTTQTNRLEKLGEGVVNGVAAAVQSGGGQAIRIEIPIRLGNKEVARGILPDLLDAAKQRGISLG